MNYKHNIKDIKQCIMFVDMVSSTELKYQLDSKDVALICKNLYNLIQESCNDKWAISFTGDGAMVVFNCDKKNGSRIALESAENIIQKIDRENLLFEENHPKIRIKIGIATGLNHIISEEANEISGKIADLAARLCAESNEFNILYWELENELIHAEVQNLD